MTANIDFVGHVHTAGNPGRTLFDPSQELSYKGICAAIDAVGYAGYVGHEFKSVGDPLEELATAYQICLPD